MAVTVSVGMHPVTLCVANRWCGSGCISTQERSSLYTSPGKPELAHSFRQGCRKQGQMDGNQQVVQVLDSGNMPYRSQEGRARLFALRPTFDNRATVKLLPDLLDYLYTQK